MVNLTDTSQRQFQRLLKKLHLQTLCSKISCPDIKECLANRTAAFLILGDTCTRTCRFCPALKGWPMPVDLLEAQNLAAAVLHLRLQHIIITSVTRDDLPLGGAEQYAASIRAVQTWSPDTSIEVLVPDFRGNVAAMNTILSLHPAVFNHFVGTVPRLYPEIRPIGDYEQSLDVLRYAAAYDSAILVKSGVFVGLGESMDELAGVFNDLYRSGVCILTITQYVRPSRKHMPVVEVVSPGKLEMYRRMAKDIGFAYVVSGGAACQPFETVFIGGK